MKKQKLQDAIGMVGDDLIYEASKETKTSSSSKIKWISVICAMLSFVIILGVVMSPRDPQLTYSSNLKTELGEFTLTKAVYPARKQSYLLLGEDAPENAYDLWFDERNEYLSAYKERNPDLTSFVKNSIPAFLGNTEGNAIYSPINVYMALALLGEISGEDSREQILEALGCKSIEELRQDANSVWKALYNDDGTAKTVLANSLWLRDDGAYNKNTLDILASEYYASTYRGKMGTKEYDMALQSWLNEQTDDMLTDQVSGIGFDPETKLAVASTLLFNAKWSDEFNQERNEEGIFHSSNGDVSCEFMKDSNSGTLFIGEEFTAVSRSFVTNGGEMMFVLPNEGVTPEELVQSSEFGDFVNCGGRDSTMQEYSDEPCWNNDQFAIINLSVPKFDVSSQLSLVSGLSKLGITNITDETKADFSPITDGKAFLYEMIHGARVTVDEKGCSAASYVVSLVGATSAPIKEVDFTLDRPFIFIITGFNGLPLYIGIVNQL